MRVSEAFGIAEIEIAILYMKVSISVLSQGPDPPPANA